MDMIHTALSVDDVDEIKEMLAQAMGVVEVIGHTDTHELSDTALSNASWAVTRMLRAIERIVDSGAHQ